MACAGHRQNRLLPEPHGSWLAAPWLWAKAAPSLWGMAAPWLWGMAVGIAVMAAVIAFRAGSAGAFWAGL